MMDNPTNQDQRITQMCFTDAYPLYLKKVEKKGRTKEQLDKIIKWLTDLNQKQLDKSIHHQVSFETFFHKSRLNPNAHLITGDFCGIIEEEIQNPLTPQVHFLDKLVDELVDELAKGTNMNKILRGT